MCGINGIFAFHADAPPIDVDELTRTREAMRMRGPDAAGVWLSPDRRVGLGHRRLSIIDLSERANQPMVSREGDVVLAFNGEIYNYKELRTGDIFETTSDSEVLLRMYRQWGADMLPWLRGMFAIAIWDARENRLFLARDPYGIKPLYYGNDGRTFRFASQVKALLAGGGVPATRDPAGIAGFLLRGHVPEPFTTYEDIRALPAGSWMEVTRDGASEPRTYFSIAEVLRDAVKERRHLSDDERANIIADSVRESVRDHLVSDVPVGAFLSAGRDSGSIVGLAQTPLQTMTMRFEGQANDETKLAADVAKQFGTTHHTVTLSRSAFLAGLPRALEAMDQPTLDGLNSYFICAAAKERGWKVALSGTGGDELFGGYSTFRNIPRFVRAFGMFKHMPLAASAFRNAYARIAKNAARFSPKTTFALQYCTSYEGAYLMKRGLFLPEEIASILGEEMAREGLKRLRIMDLIRQAITPDPGTAFARIAAMESSLLLRSQLLRDIDWASMAHSIEVRVPLVDAFLLRRIAPAVFSTNKRDGKDLLARAAHLPDAILKRRKTGFTIPNVAWLDDRRDIGRHFGMRPWALYVLRHT
jgi:asparagine synthase (glutamine-hydrolysing)